MQHLCKITVPHLSISRDYVIVRERLMAQFPNVEDVLATTSPGAIVVLTSGPSDELDAWLALIDETLASNRRASPWGRRGVAGDDTAA